TGAIIGGALGWLAGIGALAIPGLGPFIAAGPIMAALAGVGAGGAIGGIAGALIGMGIPEYEAKRYEGRVKEGGILLSVHCDDSKWTKRAKRSCSTRELTTFPPPERPRPISRKQIAPCRATPLNRLICQKRSPSSARGFSFLGQELDRE